jgi:hypothetical protein
MELVKLTNGQEIREVPAFVAAKLEVLGWTRV